MPKARRAIPRTKSMTSRLEVRIKSWITNEIWTPPRSRKNQRSPHHRRNFLNVLLKGIGGTSRR